MLIEEWDEGYTGKNKRASGRDHGVIERKLHSCADIKLGKYTISLRIGTMDQNEAEKAKRNASLDIIKTGESVTPSKLKG